MNRKQKIVTYIAIAAIAFTSLFAAWDLSDSPSHFNATRYAPVFAPPDLGPWANDLRRLWKKYLRPRARFWDASTCRK